MNAITALYSPGPYRVPYAGGPVVAFLTSQVTHIGRIATYGDFVIRYMVRVEGSDDIYFVKPSACEKSERRFLEQAQDLMKSFTSRDNPLVIVWMEAEARAACTRATDKVLRREE